jgi:hypothetical protein
VPRRRADAFALLFASLLLKKSDRYLRDFLLPLPQTSFSCYLHDFGTLVVLSPARGAPDIDFTCYLQYFVALASVVLFFLPSHIYINIRQDS